MDDVASRLANRVQLTTDSHKAYLDAVEGAFGADVDYAQLVSRCLCLLKKTGSCLAAASGFGECYYALNVQPLTQPSGALDTRWIRNDDESLGSNHRHSRHAASVVAAPR